MRSALRTVSVVIASHGRAEALDLCLTSLSQLDYPRFEIVVVADTHALDRVAGRRDAQQIRTIRCDAPNISEARNLGLAQAAGDIVAFIDDDAVAEPSWLCHLAGAFDHEGVTAAGGFVRARNGVSFQWQASSADPAGRSQSASANEALPKGHVWRTEGTNMAFHRETLIGIGGFDRAFAFYLDETDVNRRMPGITRIVPAAEVHHGYAASARRREDRVPLDLRQIGASTQVFLRKHAPDESAQRLDELRAEQRARLLRHMVAGRLEPRDIRRMMAGLEAGIAEGASRPLGQTGSFPPAPAAAFLPYRQGAPGEKTLVTGPWHKRHALWQQAREAARQGQRPTVILFAPDARFLRVRFRRDGIWDHTGGQFGKGLRSDPLFRIARRQTRLAAECARIAATRGRLCTKPA